MYFLNRDIFFSVIGFIVILLFCNNAKAENLTFHTDSTHVSYQMHIEFKKGYISGICFLEKKNNIINSSIVNEFGVSIMDFSYNIKKDKIKLMYVMNTLNNWYFKRILKKDLKKIIQLMQNGEKEYVNSKHNLSYQFTLTKELMKIEEIQ